MNKIVITFLLVGFHLFAGAQSVSVYVNDTTYANEPIKYTLADTVNGKAIAEYVNYPGVKVFEANYYYGFKSGFQKSYYPDGKLMCTQAYERGKRSGEFAQYNKEGKLVIKGEYSKGIKHGYWAYRNYMFMGSMNKGLKDGKWIGYDKDGKKVILRFKKGKLSHKKNVVLPEVPRSILMEGVTTL